MKIIGALVLLLGSASCFILPGLSPPPPSLLSHRKKSQNINLQQHTINSSTGKSSSSSSELCMLVSNNNDIDRRSALLSLGPAALALLLPNSPAFAADKIVVVGGSGFVGGTVASLLLKEGCDVISISRNAPLTSIAGVTYQYADANGEDLGDLLTGATAVVSCVGVPPGSKNQLTGNGAVNAHIADVAKKCGVSRMVYISVATQISTGPAKFLFGDYFKGKTQAENAVKENFSPENFLIIRPTVISGYTGPEVRPPGPPGVKEVPVEAVAKVAVAGALGRKSGCLDGADEIINAASGAAS